MGQIFFRAKKTEDPGRVLNRKTVWESGFMHFSFGEKGRRKLLFWSTAGRFWWFTLWSLLGETSLGSRQCHLLPVLVFTGWKAQLKTGNDKAQSWLRMCYRLKVSPLHGNRGISLYLTTFSSNVMMCSHAQKSKSKPSDCGKSLPDLHSICAFA